MKTRSLRVALVALALSLAITSVALAAARMTGPRTAHVGQKVHITASGLKPARYALAFVSDRHPARGVNCLARLTTLHKRYTSVFFNVHIPAKLTCYQGNGLKLGTIPTGTGRFHFVVGVPAGPAGFKTRYSFVRKAVRITKR